MALLNTSLASWFSIARLKLIRLCNSIQNCQSDVVRGINLSGRRRYVVDNETFKILTGKYGYGNEENV